MSERTAELCEAKQELHRLLAALAVAEEGERRGIAEGIHEDVLQRLSVVKMALFQLSGTATSAGFSAVLYRAEKEAGIVMSVLRSFTFELASPILTPERRSSNQPLITQMAQIQFLRRQTENDFISHFHSLLKISNILMSRLICEILT